MGRIFDAVIEHLDQRRLRYEKVEGHDSINISFGGTGGSLRCRLLVEEDRGLVQFWAYLPLFAPPERRQAVAEFLARANYGLRLGNFELDFNDGELRYKTSAWPGDGPFIPDQAEPLIRAAVSTANRYVPALAKVIFANMSPKQAVAGAESGETDTQAIEEIGRMLGDDKSAPPSLPPPQEDEASGDPGEDEATPENDSGAT